MVKYSIIVPVYNKEKYIKKTLESLIHQTFNDYEVIIVNDGSTDNSYEIIKDFNFEDTTYHLYDKQNEGVSAARNDGLKYAKGDYVIFNDADDIIYPNFIEEFDKVITTSNPNILYCFRDLVYKPKINFEFEPVIEGNVLKPYLSSKIRPATNGFVISRNFINHHKIKFDDDLNWGEDILFFSKLLYFDDNTKCINKRLILKDNDLQNSLSEININKIDKDFIWMKRLSLFLEEKESRLANESIKLIWGYRFPSAAINILSSLINEKSLINVKKYYDKYSELINGISYINGLRSLNLKFRLLKLKSAIAHL